MPDYTTFAAFLCALLALVAQQWSIARLQRSLAGALVDLADTRASLASATRRAEIQHAELLELRGERALRRVGGGR